MFVNRLVISVYIILWVNQMVSAVCMQFVLLTVLCIGFRILTVVVFLCYTNVLV